MALPRFEVATGLVDGVNTTFHVSVAYLGGTLAVFLNGQLKRASFADGWVESSPSTGFFQMKEAPLDGDVVQAFFIDGAATPPGETLTPIFGKLRPGDDLVGRLSDSLRLKGSVEIVPIGIKGKIEARA